jgi:predicted metal-dependent phosphoesterase TrpH
MIPTHETSRVDLHCHSTASQVSKLGVQRALGLPECATPPEEVYALARRRGMDFVTLTDHDTIQGALELHEAHPADTFVSEELTVGFKGEPQAVHVLCLGITPDDHEWLQRHNDDVEAAAAYLHDHGIACALAHPFYAVAEPLTARHRRRLTELFGVWEVRNGARAPELNQPAAVYVDTHGGIGVGGSDDHAGVDIGRTFSETPAAATPAEFLAHLRAGRVRAGGDQGSAAKWAHAAMALAVRTLGCDGETAAPDPAAVLRMVERVMREGDVRRGSIGSDLGPDDARAILRAWLASVGLGELSGEDLLARMQADDFTHAGLYRQARRRHERRLAAAVAAVLEQAGRGEEADLGAAALGVFDASVAAIPYAPAAAFLGREKRRLATREHEPVRVALVVDGVGGMHGVTHTLDEIRERGVPGFEVEVIGTDPNVDRRLTSVAEAEIPFYPGLRVGVPSIPAVVETLAEGRYELLHLCTPGPAGVAAGLVARIMELPAIGSYHTEFASYAGLRTGSEGLELGIRLALGAFYGQAARVLSPSAGTDARLAELGIGPERIGRWDRGVDMTRFSPDRRRPGRFGTEPGRVHVLYAGRLTREKGVDLLADAFEQARALDPRLHLVLAGGGAEERALRDRLAGHATFWAGSRATTSRRRTPPPTSSCSPRRPTRSARSCSRRRRPACPSWRSAPGVRRS